MSVISRKGGNKKREINPLFKKKIKNIPTFPFFRMGGIEVLEERMPSLNSFKQVENNSAHSLDRLTDRLRDGLVGHELTTQDAPVLWWSVKRQKRAVKLCISVSVIHTLTPLLVRYRRYCKESQTD